MKNTAYVNYAAAKKAATPTSATKKGPIVARALNLAHDPELRSSPKCDAYVMLNGYAPDGKSWKVKLFGAAAKAAMDLTKGDFVEFIGNQGTADEIRSHTAKVEGFQEVKVAGSITVNSANGIRVLRASQEKAEAKAMRETAKAKAEADKQGLLAKYGPQTPALLF